MSAIARAHDPTVITSVALRKGPRRFCSHRSDRCRALMLTCRNSPLWQRCEHCNVLSSSWPPLFDQFNSRVITWRALIGTSCKLAAYNYTSRLALWVRAGGCKRRCPKGQSRTGYQECGCYL